MSKIKIMNETLANKIAAGEVVEGPVNVIKEIVENAIDANSTSVKIELLDAGKKEIKVIDNGIGMDKTDAILAFSRHATSKIYKDDDLFFINTLGFRGEALASICSVSDVVMETSDGMAGTKVHIKAGEILECCPSTLRKGTTITVTNLFFNTPARLKYLKSDNTELATSIIFLEKLALSYPKISFTLTNNGGKIFGSSGSGDLLKTIHEIYGLEVSSNMIYVHALNDDYEISGYISKPSIVKSTKNHITTIVNGRVIKNNEINKMIDEGYYTYKPDSLYPIVILNIDTDPTLIDVNVHPTKQNIKFSKKDELKTLLVKAIKDALYNTYLVPNAVKDTDYEDDTVIKLDDLPKTLYVEEKKDAFYEYSNSSFEEQETIDFKSLDKNKEIKKLELYPVGIAHGTYIIAENDEGIFLIDQHAAQERINYEKVLKGIITNNKVDMLVPILIELSAGDYIKIKNNIDKLNNMGFTLEEFGDHTYKVITHPTWIKSGREEATIRSVFDCLIEEEKNFDPVKFNDKVAATIACKASIKGNSRITLDAANFLLKELVLCDNPYNCPHGRPTIIKFTKYELEKMFKRAM